jgi:hypothetical protein
MSTTTRNPTEVAFRLRTPFGMIRQPTVAECELVGRDTSYATPANIHDYRELGDYVIDLTGYRDDDDRARAIEIVLHAAEEVVNGDDFHRLPGVGIYIEE